jgi:glutathione S-transferase
MRVFGDLKSGNCLKVKWTADALGLAYTWMPVDIMKGESHTPEYLSKFPQGQVPAVEFDDGRTLAQSNAIVRYLAVGSKLFPADAYTQAKIDEWLFWEQYSHEPYIATCRFHMVYLGKPKATRDTQKVERGEKALSFMDRMLAGRPFLIGEALTIADISLLAYTRVAHEGGFDLAARPNVVAWIDRAEQALAAAGCRDFAS